MTEQLIIGLLTAQMENGTAGLRPQTASEEEVAAYEKETGTRPEVLWRMTASDIRNLSLKEAADKTGLFWNSRSLDPRNYLTVLPQMDGFYFFEPDTSELLAIEPVRATFSARNGQRYLDCSFVYLRWIEEAERQMEYTVNFRMDRSGGVPLIYVIQPPAF